jgi:hypothetical protein
VHACHNADTPLHILSHAVCSQQCSPHIHVRTSRSTSLSLFFHRVAATYEVPTRANKHYGPVMENPAYQNDGFGTSSTDAYEVMEPAAPAVPVRRVGSDTAGSGKKQPPSSSAPRWMVVAVVIALLLGAVAIALSFLSSGSDSEATPATSAPTTVQVGALVSSADLAALLARLDGYAANLSQFHQLVQNQAATIASLQVQLNTTVSPTLQPTRAPTATQVGATVRPADLAALQAQLDGYAANLSQFHQLVQNQAATIASLQVQLNTTVTQSPTLQPTRAPTNNPTSAPTRNPTLLLVTNMPTQAPMVSPTWSPSPIPTRAATQDLPAIVVSAMGLGLLLENGTFMTDLDIDETGELVTLSPLFPFISEVRGSFISVRPLVSLSFPILQTITNDLTVTNTWSVSSLFFPMLRTVGGSLEIQNNFRLSTLNGSFPELRSVGESVRIRGNTLLTSLGDSFSHLTSVGELRGATNRLLVSSNSVSFCASYASRLCPTTLPQYWFDETDGAQACCTQFCSISTLC